MKDPTDFRFRRTDDDTRSIERRIIDATIFIVHRLGDQPKAIYLTDEDMRLLPLENRREIAGIPVRRGKTSRFFTDCWRARRI